MNTLLKSFVSLPLIILLSGILLSVTGESPGPNNVKFLEHGILDYGDSSNVSPYIVSGKLYFQAKRYSWGEDKTELIYTIKPGYNKIIWIDVINDSDQIEEFKISFKAIESNPHQNNLSKKIIEKPNDERSNGLLMGIHESGGDKFLEIPPKTVITLPVNVFSQDANHGFYKFQASLIRKINSKSSKDSKGTKKEQIQIADIINGNIYVKAPRPKLNFKKKKSDGLYHSFTVKNEGEALHNFSIDLEKSVGYAMNPKVEHYLLPAGKSIDFTLYPTSAVNENQKVDIVLNASGKKEKHSVSLNVPAGMQVFTVSLDPSVSLRKKDYYCTNRPIIHLLYDIPYVKLYPLEYKGSVPKWLALKISNLKMHGDSYDTIHNGEPDHWDLIDNGQVLMSADDYNRDGKIDYFREVDTADRTLNRAYVKLKGKWHETNIVAAHLISGFLPISDISNVKPHEVNILMNNKLIRRQKKVVPTGSSIFRLRLDYLHKNKNGSSKNKITISTKHLPQAHYMVSSENTLVVHFSKVDFPVMSKLKPKDINTTAQDTFIRKYESDYRKANSEKDKKQIINKIKQLKKERDIIIKTVQKKFSKVGDTLASGIQSSGIDLGIFSNETGILSDGKITGFIRNFGYESTGYSVTLEQSRNAKPFKKMETNKYPALPPFSRRKFLFNLKSYDPKKRVLYRITVKPTNTKVKEWMISNNTSHIISGPPPGKKTRRSEMKFLANEMGVTQDQTTLTRKDAIGFNMTEVDRMRKPGNISSNNRFSAPISDMRKNPRLFVIEE